MTAAGRAAALERRLLERIPLTRAMQVRVASFDGQVVVLTAPLAPNLNDKGTGFAGSLSTLVTLSGWSLVTLLGEQALAESGPDAGEVRCEAAVVHSELDFLRPVREELRAEARLADGSPLPQLGARLASGRRVRLSVLATLGPADAPAVQFRGDYAIWRAGAQEF